MNSIAFRQDKVLIQMNRKLPQWGREPRTVNVNGWLRSDNQAQTQNVFNQTLSAPRHTMIGCVCGQNLPERPRSNNRRVCIGPTTYKDEMPFDQCENENNRMQPKNYKYIK